MILLRLDFISALATMAAEKPMRVQ